MQEKECALLHFVIKNVNDLFECDITDRYKRI